MITTANVESGVEVSNCRRAATYGRTSFKQQRVEASSGQVGGADKAIVTGTDNDDVGIVGPHLLGFELSHE